MDRDPELALEPSEGAASSPIETEVKLERADVLVLLLLAEKKARLQAEQRECQHEQRTLTSDLSAKYGVPMNEYVVDSETGIAKRK